MCPPPAVTAAETRRHRGSERQGGKRQRDREPASRASERAREPKSARASEPLSLRGGVSAFRCVRVRHTDTHACARVSACAPICLAVCHASRHCDAPAHSDAALPAAQRYVLAARTRTKHCAAVTRRLPRCFLCVSVALPFVSLPVSSLCPSVSLILSLSLSLSLCLSLSLSVSLCPSLSLSVSLCLSVALSFSLSRYFGDYRAW